MITRIELTNFMSHVHTVIEPAAGLTVLVGPNNCGKSAVVAALQILCRNDNSTYVLRHGERECGVTVVCDDGHTIEWRRKNSPSYSIDGQPFDRLRSGLPDELHQALRLPRVDAGDDVDFDVHFGTQKSPIFLLGSSPATAAKFFASSSDAIRLVHMQKLHKDKLQKAQREKTALEAESLQVNSELAALEPVVDLDRRVKQLDDDYREVLRRSDEIIGATTAVKAMDQQAGVIARHRAEAEALAGLAKPPVLVPTVGLEQLLADLPAARLKYEAIGAQAEVLVTLAGPPPQFNVTALEACCNRLVTLANSLEMNAARRHSLMGLTPAPSLSDTSTLETDIDRMSDAKRRAIVGEAKARALGAVVQPPAIADEETLSRLVRNLIASEQSVVYCSARHAHLADAVQPPAPVDTLLIAECLQKLKAAAAQVTDYAALLEDAEAALAIAADKLRSQAAGSLCPICGTPLDPERLLANTAAGTGGHAHG